MKLTAYVIDGHKVDVRPALLERDWMDQSHEHFAYRCLPLNIANTHGWKILCNAGFEAFWNGTVEKDSVQIVYDIGTHAPAVSSKGKKIIKSSRFYGCR
jgi:Family of unknown function (DUF6065)